MAETVYTLDGKAHTMLREDSLAELVEETLGPDVARKVKEMQLDDESRESLEEELADAENRAEDLENDLYEVAREAKALLARIENDDITMKEIKECCKEIIRRAD